MTDVLITPGSRKIEFFNSGDSIDATISTDVDGNLSIQNPGGDIALGDVTGDVFIGDGVNNVDLVFEQDGVIYATSGNTLTVGDSAAALVLKGSSVSLTDGDFTVDTDTFHVDAATNLVGIGTTSPSTLLHLDGGTIRVEQTNFADYKSNQLYVNNGGYALSVNGSIRLGDQNNNTVMTVDNANDRVGIGTTSPSYKVEIEAVGDNRVYAHGLGGSGSYARFTAFNDSDGAGHAGAIAELASLGWGNAYVRIADNYIRQTSGRLEIQHDTRRAWFNGTANVGIGTNSPTYKLHVNGTLGVEDSATINGITTVYGGSSGYNNWNASSLVKVENSGNTYMEFHTPSSAFTGMLFTDNTAAAGQIVFGHNGTATANTLHIQSYEDIHFRASQTNGILAGVARLAIQGSTGRIGIGTINPNVALDISSKTDALGLPKGTTAERPSSPVVGQFRYNTETPGAEIYDGTTWGAVGGGGGVTAKRTIAYSILYGRL
jgi:hypothetical protein